MEQPRSTLHTIRFWVLLDLVYGLGLTFVVVRFVPWKWPAANIAALVYLVSHVVTAPGLWRQQRWAWRVAAGTSIVGIGAGVAAVTGFVMSWSYLRSVYGSFGQGASLVSLLLAATAFQVLSLYAALRCKALLAVQGGARKGLRLLFGAVAIVPLGLAFMVHARFAMADMAALTQTHAQALLECARACLQTRRCEAQAALDDTRGIHTVYLSLFRSGQLVARKRGRGDDLSAAVMEAARLLANDETGRGNAQGRLKLDRSLATAPVVSWPRPLQALSFDAGKDGLRTAGRDDERVILPDDVIAADVFGVAPILPFLHEVRLGVSPHWIHTKLETQTDAKLERFGVESWIECEIPPGACRVDRGVVQLNDFDTQKAAALAGQFIVRSQQADGTFSYEYRPWTNTAPPAGYSVARHAGTAYALAMLEGAMPGHGFGDSSAHALTWLLAQAAPVCGGHLCVQEGPVAKVGSNALTLLALATHRHSTGDTRWESQTRALAAFLKSLQRPSGDLVPSYSIAQGGPSTQLPPQMFATEEAAMAFASAGAILNDENLLRLADETLTFLTTEKYADLLGRFTYGVDSWTCMAVAALPATSVKPQWIDFCLGYADFLGRMQFSASDRGPAFEGLYGFSHVLMPQAPPTAGAVEALAAVLAVARTHKRDVAKLEKQVTLALRALARDQVRPGNDYLAVSPPQAWGAIRRSCVESEVRIDFVQHAASALARGSALGI